MYLLTTRIPTRVWLAMWQWCGVSGTAGHTDISRDTHGISGQSRHFDLSNINPRLEIPKSSLDVWIEASIFCCPISIKKWLHVSIYE